MMYSYIILADNTEVTHSQLIEADGIEMVEVHFERVKDNGVDRAHCILPSNTWILREGFSNKEIAFFEEFLRHNHHLLFRYAAQGGIGNMTACAAQQKGGNQTTIAAIGELPEMEVRPEKKAPLR